MKIIKEEINPLNQIRKLAHSLGTKVLIVSKPEKAKVFLSETRKNVSRTADTYKKLISQVKQFKHLTHEVENLFDNYYIVDGAVSEILNADIDRGFRRLVQIEKNPGTYIPRINFILSELLKVSEYKIDRETLYSFLLAYQAKAHLSIRELSFVPFFLRTILVNNIEGMMRKSIVSLDEFKDAEYWFGRIIKRQEKSGESDFTEITSSLAHKYGVIPVNLGFHLLQKLSQYGPNTRTLSKWLKLNLLKQGINISSLAEIENRRQDEMSTQISNTINSLRWVNQARWDDFVVDVNIVDTFLAKDPAGIYAGLDQASQSAYRNEAVKISDRAGVHESEVAKLALRLCHPQLLTKETDNQENHVGYYLVGRGRDELEKRIGYQKPLVEKIRSFILKRAAAVYLGSIFIFDAILTFLLIKLFGLAVLPTATFSILTALVFILNCDIAINLINILISELVPVRGLFRLDLSSGVSLRQSTFVVIPSMFRDDKSADELLRRLEVNYLGNADENIYFALLMDFKDSKMEISPADQLLVDKINLGIEQLNEKYPSPIKRFYLFHRRRVWNPHENAFIGWERKRGKLREFNLLLRDKRPTSYIEKWPADLPVIKYVLTIDEDTRLPKDSAIKLIGCIDHPLNRPVIDTVSGRVTGGYGIIQPRMTSKFRSARATVFSRLFSSSIGIDSYTGPGADVYQDLFDNSIFFGKGIYDVDAMEATIGDRIPENQVLSHDLLEGLYTRVGFATDIFLFEGFPESYKEYILRTNRWIRGDWQIISWLKFNPAKNNHFAVSDKWKIFDNLRRSTLPIFIVVFLLFSYLFFPNSYLLSLTYALLLTGSSFVISYLIRIFEWPKEMTLFMKIDNLLVNLDAVLWQIIYRFIFILDQAIISFSAIVTSIYRMCLSHKNMLRWQNSHEVSAGLKGTLREFIYLMLPAEILSLLMLFTLPDHRNGFFFFLTLVLWLVSPFVAYQISRKEKSYQYKPRDLRLLRNIACRSARFFLELPRRDGNYLIPDHLQEEPATNSPAATSTTNIGLHLLSNFSAYDLGYLGFSGFLEHTRETFASLERLERYKGHFYNWYDIRTLQSLNPKYVSSVDSANFLISLLTLKQGMLDMVKKPIISGASLDGFRDVLNVLGQDAGLIFKDYSVIKSDRRLARQVYEEADSVLKLYLSDTSPDSIEKITRVLNSLSDSNEKIKKIVGNLNLGLNRGILSSIYSSTEHFNALLEQQLGELNFYMSFYQARRNSPAIRNENRNTVLSQALFDISGRLNVIPSLEYLSRSLKREIESYDFISLIHTAVLDNSEKENIERWYKQVLNAISITEARALESRGEFARLIFLIDKFFAEADFSFLYNVERGLFHIGYNVSFDKVDNSYYDFLASEANSISFVSIMKGDAPVKHWFYLGRKLVQLNMNSVLLSSWGGSLFEYLTSLVFFKVHKESLLGKTAKLAIEGHMEYGRKQGVPWGMGESAYSALDLNNNYQYQIFGHPSLGLKRDLKDYLVVAPYTTIMSLAFKPKEAIDNLRKMIKAKLIGRYGFYDAVDYTSSLDNGRAKKVGLPAKIYYAHHQGFSLQVLNNQINGGRIQSLLAADSRVEALDTLFEEKMPSTIPARPIKTIERLQTEYLAAGTDDAEIKQFIPQYTSYPRRAFISNGLCNVNVSNTGAGGSKVGDICLTRFREDTVAEPWGQFIYIYDTVKKSLWSPTTQPTGLSLGKNKIEYFENKARFGKIHNDVESSLTIAVAPDSAVELRSLTLTNQGKEAKNLKITSYGEVALARAGEDMHHPAFEKLFTKSEYWHKYNALVYSRPNKDERGRSLYFAHRLVFTLPDGSPVLHTTDRNQFIARGGSLRNPDIFSGHHGRLKSVLGHNYDPIFSFQNHFELKPNETTTISYVNIFAHSKEELVKSLKKYSAEKNISQAIKKSDKHGYEIINSLGMSREQAMSYQALASRLLSPHYSENIKKFPAITGEPAAQSLWRLGISGDLPILLVRFYDMNDLAMLKNMLICHKYLKYKGIAHDLVLLNEYPASYIKSFEDEVDFLVRYNQSPLSKSVRGGVFHLRSSHLSQPDVEKLVFLSRILLDSGSGTLEQQISGILQSGSRPAASYLKPQKKALASSKDTPADTSQLKFWNGLGGFSTLNREYVMNINYAKSLYTPVPWANIVANQDIGFVITESGSTYTWLFDSYDNRLTKRIDDPIIDRSSEIFYLRDEETGEFWNPTPLPIRSGHSYQVRHGLGYTKFGQKSHGLDQEMSVFVPENDAVKIVKFSFANKTKLMKKLSLTGYFEMSLGGANREDTKDYLQTVRDEETGAIVIRNIYGESFKQASAFVDLNGGKCLVTNDRDEFLGKSGEVISPSAMHREKLSDVISSDVDHCVALQTFFELAPGAEIEIISLLGGGNSAEEMKSNIKKYRRVVECDKALAGVSAAWSRDLDKIKIKTPDESLNILFNDRLLYQIITSRLTARTGYYQPSGAYGFRDQLQDSVALIWAKPKQAREMLLRASRHQFQEGDAENWWHEHNSFGVRSVFSDHQLWLPYAVCAYLEATGDQEVLNEKESYLKGALLDFINNSAWAGVPEIVPEKFDLYDHCIRAIDKTFAFGRNGLPLIGKGDWNDGLNKVGEKGAGESVWLGWFLYAVIQEFIPHISKRGDLERVKRYETTAKNLKNALDRKAWDGKWYKRAFFDNGTTLGSRSNKEFKIDSISQSWSVLSGAAPLERSRQAMNSVMKNLFQNDLLLLISPALKDSPLDPGYIKDYPPGVRENGAQYNHAALWAAQAYAELKEPVPMMKIIDSVNPIKRSDDHIKATLYRGEPYAVASDIYAKPAQAGRSGWTWYTGSAGVMYRTILENMLGFKLKADKLEINPCIPKDWTDFSISYMYKNTQYDIHVLNHSNAFANFPSAKNEIVKKITVDGAELPGQVINLIDDGKAHKVEVSL